jgi:hypothetical protein
MYLAAIAAANAHLPWYAKITDTPETRAMILSIYQAVMGAK